MIKIEFASFKYPLKKSLRDRFMSAHVKVLLHATFREAVKVRETLVEINPRSTIRDVLGKLAKRYGNQFDIIDSTTGEIDLGALVMVNGKSVRKTDTVVRDKDILMITIPLGGG